MAEPFGNQEYFLPTIIYILDEHYLSVTFGCFIRYENARRFRGVQLFAQEKIRNRNPKVQ